MTKIPTTKKELENCINYIMQFFAWLDKPIDSEKCFGFHIDDHDATFVITFGFVIENISQPHYTPPDEIIEPKSDEAKLTIVKGATSIFTLISGIEEIIDYVRHIKLITELSDRDDGADW